MAKIISAEEIGVYRHDGILVPQFCLPESDLKILQQLTTDLATNNPGLLSKPFLSPHLPHREVKTDSAAWMKVAQHPQILDLIEQLIGPDIILTSTVMLYKEPSRAPFTPFHQDVPNFPITPPEVALVWIAIFDSVVENGALRCIPGSHASKHSFATKKDPVEGAYTGENVTLEDGEFDVTSARDVILRAGQMAVFDGYLVHGAHANLGTSIRAGLALRYMPSTSHYDRELAARGLITKRYAPDAATRPIFLVRGIDKCGLNGV
jgi:hypothetical protein